MIFIILFMACFFGFCSPTLAMATLQGEISMEGQAFFEQSEQERRRQYGLSTAMELELYHELTDDLSFTFKSFYRFDGMDSQRSHGDLRVCRFLYIGEGWQFVAGLDRVFWGVTEFVHLVDIVNQTDLVEGLDGEEKLGQPMVHFSLERPWGTLDSFLLPYFRERTFPGKKGRLSGGANIKSDSASYESQDEHRHLDLALRYSYTLGSWDAGIYYFKGTSREPEFILENENIVTPYYSQITQMGLDVQTVVEDWLWKLEAVYTWEDNGQGAAMTFGFEYNMVQVLESQIDLGLICEYIHDSRDVSENSLFNDDLLFGVRINFNDYNSTELLLGVSQDLEFNSNVLSFEGSRRLGESWKAEITGYLFSGIAEDDPGIIYEGDSFIKANLTYYF